MSPCRWDYRMVEPRGMRPVGRGVVQQGECLSVTPERVAMSEVRALIAEVAMARQRFLDGMRGLTYEQRTFRPAVGEWNAEEVTEHLVRAEQSGVYKIWQAAEGVQRGTPVWQGEPVHRGLSIEEIIARTWQPKEQAPDVAVPQWHGPLAFWVASLAACQVALEPLADVLAGMALAQIIAPHPISGPLDADQRLQFLRWHLDHHRRQVEEIKRSPGYPVW